MASKYRTNPTNTAVASSSYRTAPQSSDYRSNGELQTTTTTTSTTSTPKKPELAKEDEEILRKHGITVTEYLGGGFFGQVEKIVLIDHNNRIVMEGYGMIQSNNS